MYPEERQQAIAARVMSQGSASVAELAQTYDVTTETVRRDLAVLDRAGVLRPRRALRLRREVELAPRDVLERRVALRGRRAERELRRRAALALAVPPGLGCRGHRRVGLS